MVPVCHIIIISWLCIYVYIPGLGFGFSMNFFPFSVIPRTSTSIGVSAATEEHCLTFNMITGG